MDSDFILIDSGDDVQIVATIDFEGNTTVAGSFELYFDNGDSQTLVDSGTFISFKKLRTPGKRL